MTDAADALIDLTKEMRRAFQDLGAYGAALHGDLGVNASMRAVLEYLDDRGPSTAPEIARAKNVTRQHIQNIVNQLIEAGLAEQRDNPGHKRSWLIAPTRKGRAVFAKIRAREEPVFEEIAAALSKTDMRAATATLRALRNVLQQQEKGDLE